MVLTQCVYEVMRQKHNICIDCCVITSFSHSILLRCTNDFVDVLVNYPSGKKQTQKDLLQNVPQSLI